MKTRSKASPYTPNALSARNTRLANALSIFSPILSRSMRSNNPLTTFTLTVVAVFPKCS